MKNSIRKELTNHIQELINDRVLTLENVDEWHFHAFNEDYYIIGYYQASEWLKEHNIGEFEAANICVQYEKDNFGECFKEYDNSETVVNMLAYVYGEELLQEIQDELITELEENNQ